MIPGDKNHYYLPIHHGIAWKVTRNEESEAVNKEEIEYKVNYRLYRLKTRQQLRDERRLDNIIHKLKIDRTVMADKLIKKDIVPMIDAKNIKDDWLEEERHNISRVAVAKVSVSEMDSPLLLPEDG